MNSQPNAGTAYAQIGVNRFQANPKQVDTAAIKAFLNRTDTVVENKPLVKGYSPHSVHSSNSNPPLTSMPIARVHSAGIHSSENRFSTVGSRAFQEGDDDLLTPIAAAKDDDLLAPSSNARSTSDPLSNLGPDEKREQQRTDSRVPAPSNGQAAIDPHLEVFANEKYPSALTCAKCHQKIFDEWRVSGHAYSAVSPMFQRFEQAVADLLRGTAGTFCSRCHAPVATQTNHPREAPIFSGPAVFREGITCIACHRVVERYGRVNGERRIETGSPYDPVVGSWGGDGVAGVIADAENYKVKTDPNDKRPLQAIHQGAIKFEQLSDSSFCAGCHQVVVQPGIALEIVYQQYRSGPACKKGVS